MKRDEKTFRKRSWKGIAAVGLAVCGLVGFASNLASVLTFFHKGGPAETKPVPVAFAPPAPTPTQQTQPVANMKSSVTQVSSGGQSPNLNGIHGSVDIRYGGADKAHASQPTTGATTKANVKIDSPVVQMSSGPQSPNISKIGGDVKLDYDSKTTPTAAKE